MNSHNVVIYTCDSCSECEKVIKKMDKWGVVHTVKNVSKNKEYLKELQNRGIFGTPATIVDDHPVLGYQEGKLKSVLNLGDSQVPFFRDFYDRYEGKDK